MSKDNKGIYLVSDDFNEANAHETTTPTNDHYLDDDISDQNYVVNKYTHVEVPPKPTELIDPSIISNDYESSNDENFCF